MSESEQLVVTNQETQEPRIGPLNDPGATDSSNDEHVTRNKLKKGEQLVVMNQERRATESEDAVLVQMFKVPLCYRFCPTGRELVEFFLIPKAKGLALPDGHQILERSLYGDEAAPWKVFKDDDPWEWSDDTMKKKIIYAFSRVIAMNRQSKKQMVRTAGCGTWAEGIAGKPIRGSEGNVIGYKRAFTFKPNKEFENKTRGKWTMHEYSLANKKDYKDSDVVVCRITNHVKKEGSENEDEGSGLDSDAAPNSVEKTNKREGNKRVRRGGVSTDQTGNQEGGRVVRVNTFGPWVNVSSDLLLNNQEIVFPSRGLAQQNENQEVVPYPAATPQDPHCSDTNERSTPILHGFFSGEEV